MRKIALQQDPPRLVWRSIRLRTSSRGKQPFRRHSSSKWRALKQHILLCRSQSHTWSQDAQMCGQSQRHLFQHMGWQERYAIWPMTALPL